jgi:hypothetical protein
MHDAGLRCEAVFDDEAAEPVATLQVVWRR